MDPMTDADRRALSDARRGGWNEALELDDAGRGIEGEGVAGSLVLAVHHIRSHTGHRANDPARHCNHSPIAKRAICRAGPGLTKRTRILPTCI
jgi:hypothetical protein